MYYTRAVRRPRIPRQLAPLVLAAVLAANTPITITPDAASASSERLRETAGEAVERLDEWLAPFSQPRLRVEVDRWDSPRPGLYGAGQVVATTRWLGRAHERQPDRLVVGSIAREYWLTHIKAASRDDAAFINGVSDYLAVRTMHTIFLGTHDYDRRYFGGFVPHVVRALPLSLRPDDSRPQVTWFAELDRVRALDEGETPDGIARRRRVVTALFTLERLIGWPTLQVALEQYWMQPGATHSDFSALVEQVSGRRIGPFVAHALGDQTFDYAVGNLTSTSTRDDAHPYETAVTVTRDGGVVPEIEVAVWFADGSDVRERWDGANATHTFRFASRAPARAAQIDPQGLLLLDRNRSNNSRMLARSTNPLAIRGTLRWLVWLQNVMLTYGGLA